MCCFIPSKKSLYLIGHVFNHSFTLLYTTPSGHRALAVFLSVFGQSFAAECPKIVTQQNFNITRYLGLWYEIERNNIIFEVASKCENATYTANPNGTVGVWNQAVTGYTGYYSIYGIAEPKNPDDPAALVVIFTDPVRKGDYNVIATDYVEYALVYACEVVPVIGVKVEFIWLLSRTKALSPSRVNELKKILTDMGVGVDSVHPTEQNCS